MPLEQKINKLEGDVEGWSQKWLEQVNKHSDTRAEVRRLTEEVERLRLTEREVRAILAARFVLKNYLAADAKDVSALDDIVIKHRLGGGE